MKIAEIISCLEVFAHPSLQEDYDNAGLITGSSSQECTGAIISLDATEAVVQEAIDKHCNLVIAHHPIIFRGLKKINGKNYIEKTIIKAIKHDIAIYAIHTNLDNVQNGVNGMIAEKLGLINCRILAPKNDTLKKLCVFVPEAQAAQVRNAIFEAGAGHIGNYSECSFNTSGMGTFKPGEGTQPFVGEKGLRQQEPELKIETVFPSWLAPAIVKAMKSAHPYEEVAFDIFSLGVSHQQIGSGILGELSEAMNEAEFLNQLKEIFEVPVIRHTALLGKPVKKIAVCGGAGSFLISNAIGAGTDVFVTADMKYHEFFDANGQLIIADIGHYESEQFTIALLHRFLQEKFPTFAALKTGVKTNPVNYFLL